MANALRTVGLAHLVEHLDEDGNWAQRLSGGEQQRLGFARVSCWLRPSIVFLDEATSALDEPGRPRSIACCAKPTGVRPSSASAITAR